MARLPRLTVAGYPHHIIQRGNNRQPIVVDAADYRDLLARWQEAAARLGVAVHAYVVMSNHVHLLATPQSEQALPLFMQDVGRGYVRRFNLRHGRTGTLWEGRYRSTVIDTDRYMLACMAYIDLNPVRADMVAAARDYPWSSHGHYVGLRVDPLVTAPPSWWGLGNTPFAREQAYADLVQAGVNPVQQTALVDATLKGWALGDADFVAQLQNRLHRRVRKGAPGRPVGTVKASEISEQSSLDRL